MPTPPRPFPRVAGLLVVLLLAGLAAASVLALRPPAPAAADAPSAEFSATRAFEHVRWIAAETHVAGSPAGDRVVDRLVATLEDLGLDTRVQRSVGAWQYGAGVTEMAAVRNVVAVLPGTDPTGRLYLVAHHDSVETGPGAADDAAGVSAILESVRALTESGPLRNDVVVLLTDAEEACLCGAEAFAASHPLAEGGGVVLNFEARGTTGPPIMFETSLGNAGLADAFADAAPHQVASSFAVEVYRALPNDTDFSVLLADGRFTGLNTAFIDGAAAYHTPQDVPERLDRGTLQAMGDNALALARELGDRDLTALREPGVQDATYFPVLDRLARYPGSWVWPLAAASGVAVLLLVAVARVRGRTSLPRVLLGTVLAAVPLVAGPLAVLGLWRLMVAMRPGYGAMLDPWRPGPYRLAAVGLVLAVTLVWYALLRRRLGPVSASAGGLVWLAVLAGVLAAAAPGGSYLAAWPALAGALAGLVTVLTGNRVVRALAVLAAGGVAVLVLAPTVSLFLPALGMSAGAAPAFVVAMLAVALLPAFELLFPHPDLPEPTAGSRLAAAAVPGVALVTTAACAVAGFLVDTFDRTHPVPSELVYVLDADAGRAWWATTEADPAPYTAGYVGEGNQLDAAYPYLEGADVRTGEAQVAELAPPEVVVASDAVVGERREISVRVTPRRPGVRLVTVELAVEGGTVQRARASGRDVPGAALGEDRLRVTFHAPPEDGLQVSFSVSAGAAAALRVIDGSDGLDGLPGHEPRPEAMDAAGSHSSDLVMVATTTDLG